MASIAELEELATNLFCPDVDRRQHASAALELVTKDENETALLAIFSSSTNQYAIFYASQAMVQWTKTFGPRLSVERRQHHIQRVGDALRRISLIPHSPKAMRNALIACYAKLMKLGFEKEPCVIDTATAAIQLVTMASDDDEYRLGLQLLDGILAVFSAHDSSKTQSFMNFTTHRRCSNNFRDMCLHHVFLTALTALKRVDPQNPTPSITETVTLVQKCLSYDFMAIMVDETEDAMSSQFPASWREVILSDDTTMLLWTAAQQFPLPHATTIMKGIASLCGIRRTFFESVEERQQYITRAFTFATTTLLELSQRKDQRSISPAYLNEVADGCVRFVSPFGYRDLHTSPNFFNWISAVKALTLEVLTLPMGTPPSHQPQRLFHPTIKMEGQIDGAGGGGVGAELPQPSSEMLDYTAAGTTLMNFWSRLISSMRMYCSANDEVVEGASILLEGCVSEIMNQFFQTRITAAPEALIGAPLCEETKMLTDAIMSQSDSLATMCLLTPAPLLSQLGEYLTRQVPIQMLCNNPSSVMWLLYVAGSMVRSVLSCVEEPSVAAEVLFFRYCVECVTYRHGLFGTLADSRAADDLTSIFGTLVELAQIHFLTYIQMILCGDRLHHALQQVVVQLFQSPIFLFQFLLTNTGQNITRSVETGGDDDHLINIMRSSIDLIAETSSQMQAAVAQEVQLDLPPVMELPLSLSIKTYRLRTNIYHMLWPLRMPLRYNEEAFREFLRPVDHCIHQTMSGAASNPSFIAGWLRDLRGIARAVTDRQEAKHDFVNWFCGNAGSLHSIIEGPAGDSPMVIISFLRFAGELITSKHGHNLMDRTSHSATGLLLFKVICSFIQQIVERCITDDKIRMVTSGGPVDGAYEVMLKPLSLCMSLMRVCVVENFVPFGAMWFYQDDTYDNTLLGLLRMITVFPSSIFKEYGKVSMEVLKLLRGITDEQTYHPLVKLSTPELEGIFNFVVERCEDVSLATAPLLHGMTFLSFIAELIKDVKELSSGAGSQGVMAPNPSRTTTPPRSPIPSYYLGSDGLSLSSVSPGQQRHASRTGSARSLRSVRRALAQSIEPMQGLWTTLIHVGMNVIVSQDRAISASCSVVYPIFEAHPPFWYEFVENFVSSYPAAKQPLVRDVLALLSNSSGSSEAFFSEVFSFRQKMREI